MKASKMVKKMHRKSNNEGMSLKAWVKDRLSRRSETLLEEWVRNKRA